jgi:hypothetical protein
MLYIKIRFKKSGSISQLMYLKEDQSDSDQTKPNQTKPNQIKSNQLIYNKYIYRCDKKN